MNTQQTKTDGKVKSFSFQSTTRANFVFEQVVAILNSFPFVSPEAVKLTGNVVTVPEWFPFSPSVN